MVTIASAHSRPRACQVAHRFPETRRDAAGVSYSEINLRCGLFQAPIIKNLLAIWGSKLLYGAYATGKTAGSPYGALYQNTSL